MKIKESDLAKTFINSFNGSGYEIYQEVENHNGITDIVLKHSNFIWAIEVKLGLSLGVIAQARFNQRLFHFSSICVLKKEGTKQSEFAREICKIYGIGIFKIDYKDYKYNLLDEVLKAKLNRKALVKYVNLVEHQKTYAMAGNSESKRWTPFNQTKFELIQFVSKNPGCKLKEALTEIRHHYNTLSSAQNSIRQWIKKGIITEISLDHGILNLRSY